MCTFVMVAARCAFEREISQMATPATDVLDCRFLHEKMEAWDCADDLETFILLYKNRGGANKNPESCVESKFLFHTTQT